MAAPRAMTAEAMRKLNLEDNRVIIRIWTSGANIFEPGHNVGHVSLQVEDRYMSLWPKEAAKAPTESVPHVFVRSYEEELTDEYEGRLPEYTICLYTLNVDNIKQKFASFQSSLEGWCLFGAVCQNAHSCVSMAWELLKAGGINSLVSPILQSSVAAGGAIKATFFGIKGASTSNSGDSSRGASYSIEEVTSMLKLIKSPDALASIALKAKEQEWKKDTLIRSIDFPGETPIDKFSAPSAAAAAIAPRRK